MKQETINIDIGLANDTEFASSSLRFEPSGYMTDSSTGEVIVPAPVVVELDGSGTQTTTLFPPDAGIEGGHYVVYGEYVIESGDEPVTVEIGNIQPLDGEGPYSLAALLQAGGAIAEKAYYSVITETERQEVLTARDEAVEARDEAEEFAGSVQPYADRAAFLAATVPAPVLVTGWVTESGSIALVSRDATGPIEQTDGTKWTPANKVTPQHFGAVADGATSDSAAFQAMWDWVIEDSGSFPPIHIPAGEYLIDEQIVSTADPHNDSATRGLYITGDGASTVIINDNPDGLLKWNQTSARDIRVHIKDLGVKMANVGSNGIIFDFEQLAGGLSRQSDVVFENINIYPDTLTDNYAVKYFKARGFYWPVVKNCYAGTFPTGNTLRNRNRGRVAVDFKNCYGGEIIGSKFWGAFEAFWFTDENNPGGEGGAVRDSVFDTWRGGYVYTPGTEPAFTVDDTHLNCVEYNLKIKSRKLVRLRDSVWYQDESAAESSIENLIPNNTDLSAWGGTATVTAAADEADFETVQVVEDADGSGNPNRTTPVTVVAGTDYCVSAILAKGTAEQTLFSAQGTGWNISGRITWGADGVPSVVAGTGLTDGVGMIDMGGGFWMVYAYGNTDTATSGTANIWPASFVGGGTSTGTTKVVSMQLQTGTEPSPHITTGATAVTAHPVDLVLEDVEDLEMDKVTFWFGSNSNRTNVSADGDCRRLCFSGNVHESAGTAYNFASGIDQVLMLYNKFGSSITTEVVDGGVTDLQRLDWT